MRKYAEICAAHIPPLAPFYKAPKVCVIFFQKNCRSRLLRPIKKILTKSPQAKIGKKKFFKSKKKSTSPKMGG